MIPSRLTAQGLGSAITRSPRNPDGATHTSALITLTEIGVLGLGLGEKPFGEPRPGGNGVRVLVGDARLCHHAGGSAARSPAMAKPPPGLPPSTQGS